MRRGDVICAFDGQRRIGSNAFNDMMAQAVPGATVRITVLRDGKEQVLHVTIGSALRRGSILRCDREAQERQTGVAEEPVEQPQ
jgi:S1-C subfamily serine protease